MGDNASNVKTKWRTIREQFAKKLRERRDNPKVDSTRLIGMPNCHKIGRHMNQLQRCIAHEHKVPMIPIPVGHFLWTSRDKAAQRQ